MKHLPQTLWLLACAAVWLPSCGRDNGYVYDARPVQRPDGGGSVPSFELADTTYAKATWYLPCATNPMTIPAPAKSESILVDAGPHNLFREQYMNVPLTIKGTLCPPPALKRDVVIAVDISGSMSWDDPLIGGTCERMRAVNAIIDTLPADAHIALFTFEEAATGYLSSNQFYSSKAALYAALTNARGTKIEDEICRIRSQRTNLNVALNMGQSLLQKGRGNNTRKELFIVSDGDPENYDMTVGRAVAQDLKTRGVTIGNQTIPASIVGVTISNHDKFLHSIVSSDLQNKPLIDASRFADRLSQTMNQFTRNAVVNAVLIREQTSRAAETIDLMQYVKNYTFEIPEMRLQIEPSTKDLTLSITYTDVVGNTEHLNGQIQWRDFTP